MNNITQVNMIHQNSYHKFSQETSKATGNVTSSNSKDLNQLPYIKLPFPPTIRASDIAKKRIRSKICSKSPNAFFVYRKAFVDQLSNFTGKNKLKMTEVSRLVSSRWKMESKQVKLAYEEIAKQVEQELNNIRNKDLVYTDDFDIGRRKKKNNKREEFPNYHSPISDKLICDDSNLLTPPNHGSELDTLYDNYNDYNVQYQQNEFHLYESFLKNNETPNYPSYPIFDEDRGLDFYLGYYDNLS
ncbi:6179_t:CDS:2 [Rhizophagus irregularis]|nr:6179_t:CDS:2 [Rhizophagus irregularis]